MPPAEEVRIFKQIQQIENLNWVSKEERAPYDYVEEVVESMMVYETQDWLRGNSLVMDYDTKIIRYFTTYSNCIEVIYSMFSNVSHVFENMICGSVKDIDNIFHRTENLLSKQ